MTTSKSVKEFALIGFILLAVLFGMQIMTFIFGNLGAIDSFDDDAESTLNEVGWVNQSGYVVAVEEGTRTGTFVLTALDENQVVVTNETGVYGNGTAFTVAGASDTGASRFIITDAWMRTVFEDAPFDFQFIPLATNVSMTSAGVVTNLTEFNASLQTNLSVSYTYTRTLPLTNATIHTTLGLVRNATDSEYSNVSMNYTYTRKTDQEVVSEQSTNDSLVAIGNYAEQSGTQFTTLGIAITLVILVAVFIFFWKAFMGGGRKGKGSSPGSFS